MRISNRLALLEHDRFGDIRRMLANEMLESGISRLLISISKIASDAHSKTILCRRIMLVFDHVLKASLAEATASLNSDSVVSGTRLTIV